VTYPVYNSLAQETFLRFDADRAARMERQFRQLATPEAAASVALMSDEYPQNSDAFIFGTALSGQAPQDPHVQQLAQVELGNRDTLGPVEESGGGVFNLFARGVDELIFDPIKGATRYGMMGLMSVWEMTLGGAPLRTGSVAKREDRSGSSAFYEQGPFATTSLADMFGSPSKIGQTLASTWKESTTRDEEQEALLRSGDLRYTSNVGAGFFPSSDVDPEVQQRVNEEFARLEAKLSSDSSLSANEKETRRLTASPEIWRNAIAQSSYQAALGRPTTQLGYSLRESVLYDVPTVGGSGAHRTPWSPGRFVTATVMEPGTSAFSRTSGTLDFTSQLVLDPLNVIGAKWAKAGYAKRLLGSRAKAAARTTQRMDLATDPQRLALPASVATGTVVPPVTVTGPGVVPPTTVGGRSLGPELPTRVGAVGETPTDAAKALADMDAKPRGSIHSPGEAGVKLEDPIGTIVDPVLAYGGEYLDDATRQSVRAKINELRVNPTPNAAVDIAKAEQMLADDVWFNNFEAYTSWKRTRGAAQILLDEVGTDAAVIDDVLTDVNKLQVLIGSADNSADMIDNIKLVVQDTPLPAPRPRTPMAQIPDDLGSSLSYVGGSPGAVPWWMDPRKLELRSLGPLDPPEWYVEAHHGYRAGRVPPGVPVVTKRRAGIYQVDVAGRQGKYTIQKVGRRWRVLSVRGLPEFDDDFKTLKEASEAVLNKVTELQDDPKFLGRTLDEFTNEFEDFFLEDGMIDELSSAGWGARRVDSEVPALRRVSTQAPKGGNAKVRVFGKTLDLTQAPGRLPKWARDALIRSRKLDRNGFRGFRNPRLDKFGDLPKLMRENGYGKIKFGDDEWIILDDFVGGSADVGPFGRVWFAKGDQPIRVIDDMTAVGPTPNMVNRSLDTIRDVGRYALDDAGVVDANRLERRFMTDWIEDNKEHLDELNRIANQNPLDRGPLLDKGPRPTVEPSEVSQLIGSDRLVGQVISDILVMATKPDGAARIDRWLRYYTKRGVDVPLWVRDRFLKAETEEDVARVFNEWLGGLDGTSSPTFLNLPGGTRYGRTRGIQEALNMKWAGRAARGERSIMTNWVEKPWLARRLAQQLPWEPINMVDDPSGAYSSVLEVLPNYNVTRGMDPLSYIDEVGDSHTTRAVEDVLTDWRTLQPGDSAQARQVYRELTEILFASLARDEAFPPELIRWVTRWMDDTGSKRVWDSERTAKISLGPQHSDGPIVAGQQVPLASPALTSEAWSGVLYFPDPREVKRIASHHDLLGKISASLTSKTVVSREGRLVSARKAARQVRKEAGEVSLSDIEKTIISEAPDVGIQDRTWFHVASWMVDKLWKPLVLLRGAWTFRIGLDDQMRMAAEGYETVLTHPFNVVSAAMAQPKSFWTAFKRGYVDVNGVRFSIKEMDQMGYAHYFKSALMNTNLGGGVAAQGKRYTKTIRRENEGYSSAVADKTQQFAADPIMRRLARSQARDPVDEVVVWLQGQNRRGEALSSKAAEAAVRRREALAEQVGGKHLPQVRDLILEGDYDMLYQVVEQQMYGRLHRMTGGVVVIDDGRGGLWGYNEAERVRIGDAPIPKGEVRERVIVQSPGDRELLDIIGDGKGHMKSRIKKENIDLPDDAGVPELRKVVKSKVGKAEPDRFPSTVEVYDHDKVGARTKRSVTEVWDDAMGGFYGFFMSKPSNWLARIPLFGQAYWRRIGEFMPWMSDGMRARFIEKAEEAGMLKVVLRMERQTKKGLGADQAAAVRGTFAPDADANGLLSYRLRILEEDLANGKIAPNETQGIMDVYNARKSKILEDVPSLTEQKFADAFDALDAQAKAFGLAQVERTLFTLVSRRNISDSVRLIFPFAEAWGEFLTRWGRLMVWGDRNVKNMNRFQQVINGLRESNPIDAMTGNAQADRGFFYENEYGQEVFAFPAFTSKAMMNFHNVLTRIPVVNAVVGSEQVDPRLMDRISMTGNVSSLNFAAGVIPGFGPVIQQVSKNVMGQNPEWDWLRDIIAPYGTDGGWENAFLPAWIKRMRSAQGSSDTALNYTYQATVQDVLATSIELGMFDGLTTPGAISQQMEWVEKQAKGILMVRAAATWGSPASPSYRWEKKDRTGMVWAYTQLGQEYRRILEEDAGNDDHIAYRMFYDRFGFLPAPFIPSRTYAVEPRGRSVSAGRFERLNQKLFDEYPGTAMFLDPKVGLDENYNFSLTLSQLAKGEREAYTPEQYLAISQDFMGDLAWAQVQKDTAHLVGPGLAQTRVAAESTGRAAIQARYPHWNQPILGKRNAITNDQQMMEVGRWLSDERLAGRQIVEAAREYEAYREALLSILQSERGLSSLDGSSDPLVVWARATLRTQAEIISARVPQFDELYRNVYAREVDTYHDGYKSEVVQFGDGDLFYDTLGVDPSVLPLYQGMEAVGGSIGS
jgi:hypothetical protein